MIMYCKKCGREYKSNEKFCYNCGEKLEEKVDIKELKEETNSKKNKTSPKKKKSTLKWAIISILLVLLFVFSTVFFVTSIAKYTLKVAGLEYINLDIDKIPTMIKENPDITMDSIDVSSSHGEIKIEATYNYDLYKYDMINKYSAFLEDNGFICVEDNYPDWFLIKESSNKEKVIIINIYENEDNTFSVVYELKYGKISDYVTIPESKRVGKDLYGYIDLDDTYTEEVDNGLLKYYNNKDLVMLYYVDNKEISLEDYVNEIRRLLVEEDNATEPNLIGATIDNYKAYQLSGEIKKDNLYFAIWCFADEDGIIHYIEIDSSKENSETFSKISTYKVKK